MKLGIIGGSGLYAIGDESRMKRVSIDTPFGKPSGEFVILEGGETELVFLPRHGSHHSIQPSEINYRANIYGMKKLGVGGIVSVSAVGSMKEDIPPGDFVLPDQYIDMTRTRERTFFSDGVVAHAHFADPACEALREHVTELLTRLDIKCHRGGTYVCIEGPQFSTRAESLLFRSWGVSVIGMTALPEARLAREAGLCYQTVAMSTDYDCWNTSAGDVAVAEIIRVLQANVAKSKRLVESLAATAIPKRVLDKRAEYQKEMQTSVMTPIEAWPSGRREALELILS